MMSIYDEIKAERAAQDAKWGGPEHDDKHNPLEWLSYILEHAAKALGGTSRADAGDNRWTFTVEIPNGQDSAFRRQMVRVAALSIAAMQAHDRKLPRPVEPKTEEQREANFIAGRLSVFRSLLGEIAGELQLFGVDLDQKDATIARLLSERADVVRALRLLCDRHGDNDWEDNLHLVDVLDHHLERHLEEDALDAKVEAERTYE